MSIFNDLAGQGNVLFIGLGGSVNHDGGETAVDTALTKFEAVTMVQMQSDRNIRVFNHSRFNQLDQIGMVRISAGAFGDLEDDGCLQLAGGLGDALNDLHVVDVECADGVTAVIGLLKHFGCGNKCHKEETSFIINTYIITQRSWKEKTFLCYMIMLLRLF